MKAILLNRILLVLAFAGLFVAGVLSLGHIIGADVPCGGDSGCATVANHPASSFFGVLPVAYLGFLTYVGLAALAIMRSARGMRNSQGLVIAGYVLAAVGTVFSLYLQYQSFMVIRASCRWCIASAGIMIATLVLHAFLAQASDSVPDEAPRKSPIDSLLVMALPLLALVGIGMVGFSMKKAADQPALSGSIVMGKAEFDKMTAGTLNSIGPKDAALTIIEFADLQCGACQSNSPMLKAFAEQFPNKIRLIYKHFPLKMHQWSTASAAASQYAAEKGKFWEMAMAIMALNRELESPDELVGIGQQVGLDTDDMQERLANPEDKIYQEVVKDMDLAGELGVVRTPTFFLATDGGNVVEVTTSKNVFEKLQSAKYKKIING